MLILAITKDTTAWMLALNQRLPNKNMKICIGSDMVVKTSPFCKEKCCIDTRLGKVCKNKNQLEKSTKAWQIKTRIQESLISFIIVPANLHNITI